MVYTHTHTHQHGVMAPSGGRQVELQLFVLICSCNDGTRLSSLCPPGSWTSSWIPPAGSQAPAAAGGEGPRALRLRLEGPDDERIRGSQDLPHPGSHSDGFTMIVPACPALMSSSVSRLVLRPTEQRLVAERERRVCHSRHEARQHPEVHRCREARESPGGRAVAHHRVPREGEEDEGGGRGGGSLKSLGLGCGLWTGLMWSRLKPDRLYVCRAP